jgi:putative ABC transport system permease protein
MIKNYLKIAWRNLIKDRQFTLLNLMGLSSGLACALLIYLWVHDELSVDNFNEKGNRIYQLMKASPNGDGTITVFPTTQGLLAHTMEKELPEVEYAVAVRPKMSDEGDGIISVNDKKIKVVAEFADQNFFNIFSYSVIEGNKITVLSDIYGAVISDKLALKLFNTTNNIIGKSFSYTENDFAGLYKVSGVFKSPPLSATENPMAL